MHFIGDAILNDFFNPLETYIDVFWHLFVAMVSDPDTIAYF